MATVNCNYCSSNHQIPIQKYGSFLKYPNKELLKSKRSSSVPLPLPLKRAPAVVVQRRRRMITASIRNKVYEDKSEGIVCYQDERGEIICEGYDEGPCFQRIPNPTSYHHPRDAEMTNLVIGQGWLKIESKEAVLKEDLNSCNGFTSFR